MWEDKDGAKRNIDKFKKEWDKVKDVMKPEWQRFFQHPFDGHSYINLFVESRRISPYLIGHIDAILYLILIGTIIYLGFN